MLYADAWTEGRLDDSHGWLDVGMVDGRSVHAAPHGLAEVKHLSLVGVLVVRAQNPGVLSSGYKARPHSSVAAQHLRPSSLAWACCDGLRAGGTALSQG